jgi:hypothetical protein
MTDEFPDRLRVAVDEVYEEKTPMWAKIVGTTIGISLTVLLILLILLAIKWAYLGLTT